MIDRARAWAAAVATTIAAIAASIVDLVATGGDVLVALGVFLVSDISLIVSFTAYLERLAGRFDAIPATLVSDAYNVVLILVVLVLLARLVRRWKTRREA